MKSEIQNKALVYIIPSPIDENECQVFPLSNLDFIKNCQVFFAENLKRTRGYLKNIFTYIDIDTYRWFELNKHDDSKWKKDFTTQIQNKKIIGIFSDSGCPTIADPGSQLISIAHKLRAEVKPLVGPSSILLALMASGFNGQSFQFNGYLPIKKDRLGKKIKELEKESIRKKTTQIFIEAPYRNNRLVKELINNSQPQTLLCIATELTGKKESIQTMSIEEWQKNIPNLEKKNTVFLVSAQ